MKRITLSLSVIVALTILSFTSQATNVSGGIHVNTTWTLANSPYIVVDTVVVFPGITLTIQPGVIVKFNNNIRLEIRQATLIANGTSTNPITFTSNSGSPTVGIWESLYLNGIIYSKFNYCNFQYAVYGIYDDNYGDSLRIENSNFTNNQYGLYSYNFSLNTFLVNCNINNNSTGVYAHENVIMSNCNVSNNQTGANLWGYCHIVNSIVDSNSVEGLNISAWQDLVKNNEIKYNGIGIHDFAMGPAAVITKNIIENNGKGILLGGSADSIFCNKICSNTSYDLYYNAAFTSNAAYCANNYWCTPDSISTAAVVYDGYDNINYGLVNFMPLDTSNCYISGCNILFHLSVVNATCANCPTGSATVNASNGTGPYTYTWYSSPLQNTQTATGLASGWYKICVTDANSCSHCDSVFVDSTNCTGFSIVTSSTNATCSTCADGTANVIAHGGTAPYHYTWYTSPLQSTDSISGLAHGTYHVCVTDANGCTACDSSTVNVGNCSAHFNVYANSAPHTYTLVNMASGAAPLTYYWSWGDGTHDTAAYPSHTYAATGFYNICLTITDNVGCTNTYCSSYYLLRPQSQMVYVNVISATSVGINQLIADNSISIYPNPFTSQTTISFSTEQTNTSIKITDVIGKEIKTINFTGTKYILEKGIMKPGIYFVQITDANKNVVNRKVVVQ